MASNGQPRQLHLKAGLLLKMGRLVDCRDIFPETSKNSAFWDMGGNSNQKWLPLFHLYIAPLVESDGTSLTLPMTGAREQVGGGDIRK